MVTGLGYLFINTKLATKVIRTIDQNLYKDKNQLIASLINYLNLNNKNEADFKVPEYTLKSEKIITDEIDYYHSNAIARASKTMSECKNIRMSLPKTGTDN